MPSAAIHFGPWTISCNAPDAGAVSGGLGRGHAPSGRTCEASGRRLASPPDVRTATPRRCARCMRPGASALPRGSSPWATWCRANGSPRSRRGRSVAKPAVPVSSRARTRSCFWSWRARAAGRWSWRCGSCSSTWRSRSKTASNAVMVARPARTKGWAPRHVTPAGGELSKYGGSSRRGLGQRARPSQCPAPGRQDKWWCRRGLG
jgi:hypothetical protein